MENVEDWLDGHPFQEAGSDDMDPIWTFAFSVESP